MPSPLSNAVILKLDEVVLTNQLRISTNQKIVNYKSRVLHDLDLYNQPQSILFFLFKSHMSSIIVERNNNKETV